MKYQELADRLMSAAWNYYEIAAYYYDIADWKKYENTIERAERLEQQATKYYDVAHRITYRKEEKRLYS